MPTTRIEIENIRTGAWVAEAEFGGITAFRVNLRGETFYEVMDKVIAAYEERTGDRRPPLECADWISPETLAYIQKSLTESGLPVPDISGQNHWRTWKAKVEAAGGTWTNVADAKAFLAQP